MKTIYIISREFRLHCVQEHFKFFEVVRMVSSNTGATSEQAMWKTLVSATPEPPAPDFPKRSITRVVYTAKQTPLIRLPIVLSGSTLNYWTEPGLYRFTVSVCLSNPSWRPISDPSRLFLAGEGDCSAFLVLSDLNMVSSEKTILWETIASIKLPLKKVKDALVAVLNPPDQ